MSDQPMPTEAGDSGELFDDLPVPVAAPVAPGASAVGRARVILPNRDQVELRPMDLESLLPEGHRARLVWAWVERQDLSAYYAAIKVREGGVGRSAIAPQILLALWLYAILEGVGSARTAGSAAACRSTTTACRTSVWRTMRRWMSCSVPAWLR
jgi:hypothetical protein